MVKIEFGGKTQNLGETQISMVKNRFWVETKQNLVVKIECVSKTQNLKVKIEFGSKSRIWW